MPGPEGKSFFCNRCKQDLDIGDFSASAIRSRWHACKACCSVKNKKYFSQNRPVFMRSEVFLRCGIHLSVADIELILKKFGGDCCFVTGVRTDRLTLMEVFPGRDICVSNAVPVLRSVQRRANGLPAHLLERWREMAGCLPPQRETPALMSAPAPAPAPPPAPVPTPMPAHAPPERPSEQQRGALGLPGGERAPALPVQVAQMFERGERMTSNPLQHGCDVTSPVPQAEGLPRDDDMPDQLAAALNSFHRSELRSERLATLLNRKTFLGSGSGLVRKSEATY